MTTPKDTRHLVGTTTIRRGPDSQLQAGVTLQGRYMVLSILGVGGMGAVYQARDLHFPNVNKLVAVKEMINLASDPALQSMIVRNFEREADLLATLNHQSLPEIYDYFSQGERSYLVLEYIQGRDLEAIQAERNQPLSPAEVVDWAIQLCDVLAYLHGHTPQAIVFRDMKPSNVMLDQHGRIRLIDFGIAKGFQANQKGTMIGTEGYSPPEQYRGEASVASDLYSLGATLHHLLTNQDPRLEAPFSFGERPLRLANPAVSADLEAVIAVSLQYNPADRFQSAADMKHALEATVRPVAALAAPGTARVATGPSLGGAAPAATRPSSTPLPGRGVHAVWSFACEDEIRGSPIVHEGILCVGSYDHNLYGLDAASGQFLWKYPTDGGLTGQPAIWQDTVLIGSEDRRLHAVSLRTGKVQWTYYTNGPVRSSPRMAEGHAFIGSDDNHLHAVNVSSGRAAWKAEANAAVRSTAAVAGERVYFGCESGDLYCLDFSGAMKWRFKAKRAITSSPLLVGEMLYVTSVDWMLYALEASSGWAVWRYRMGKASISTPAMHGHAVIVGCTDGFIYSVDSRSGKENWRTETEAQVTASPLVHQGMVYCGSVDGRLYCLEATSGKLRWRFETEGPITGTPFAAGEMVYVGSHDRRVYALTV